MLNNFPKLGQETSNLSINIPSRIVHRKRQPNTAKRKKMLKEKSKNVPRKNGFILIWGTVRLVDLTT